MVVHSGKRGEERDDAEEWRLFVVRGEKENEANLLQVRRGVSALRSRGAVLLINTLTAIIHVWHGAKSLKHTRSVAMAAANALKQSNPVEIGFRVNYKSLNGKTRPWPL